MSTYKVLLVGSGGSGKSTYVKKFRTGEFEKKYIPTVGVEVHPRVFHTNQGAICVNVWDCAGQEKFGGLRHGYYCQADAAIIMFDLTSRMSFRDVLMYFNDIRKICGDIPIVVAGNKVDILDRKVKERDITPILQKMGDISDKSKLHYCDVSAKTNYNFEKPFLSLIRDITEDSSLRFMDRAVDVISPKSVKSTRRTFLIESLQEIVDELRTIDSGEEEEEEE